MFVVRMNKLKTLLNKLSFKERPQEEFYLLRDARNHGSLASAFLAAVAFAFGFSAFSAAKYALS